MRQRLCACLLLVVATVVLFVPVARYDFVKYDDPTYVTNNPHVRSGLNWENVRWAFTSRYANNWHPLTWLSHMLDCELFGLNPGAHHLVNVGFHTANSLLLFLVLTRMTRELWPSAFVAALFALHPLHVESVAWIAERKDVLSTLFWLLTMWAYASYVERRTWWRYASTLGLFALGLMSKPMLVTLPFVLLLLDYWPLGRIRRESGGAFRQCARLVFEKSPFFLLSAVSSAITFWAQNVGGTVISAEGLPVWYRIANTLVAYGRYLSKTIWPTDLAVFYPHPGHWAMWRIATAIFVLAAVTVFAMRVIRSRPYLFVGWFWFLGTLIPVIGLVQVGGQSLADRYSYVPLIGVFVVAGWGCRDAIVRAPATRRPLISASIVLLMGCAIVSSVQLRYWRNSFTLFEHALRVTRDNHVAHNNLGIALAESGHVEEAIAHFEEQVRIRPNFASAHNNLGLALASKGATTEAEVHFRRAVEINPAFAEAQDNLGCALANQGRTEEAIVHFQRAVESKPDFVEAHYHLASALLERNEIPAAVTQLRRTLGLAPGHLNAKQKLASVLAANPKLR